MSKEKKKVVVPLISIIIPTLNEESGLEKILKKLTTAIKKTSYELIITDGGSKDKTIAIARKYAHKVVIHKEKRRQNIAQGRNEGAKRARGKYLIFLDADVTINRPDDFFANALAQFEKNSKLVALTSKIRVLPQKERWDDWLIYVWLNSFHKIMNNLFHQGRSAGEFQMHLAKSFRKIGGFNIDFAAGEDYELFMRCAKQGRTRLEPSLIVYHTGRRAHKIGWPRLLMKWTANSFSASFRHRSISKEWEVIR